MTEKANLYSQLIEWVFNKYWTPGATTFVFERADIEAAVEALGVQRPKNLGDVLYTFRFRQPLPESVRERAPQGLHWVIKANGRASYRFKAVERTHVEPATGRVVIKLPDATPEIIRGSALGDEQALLAMVRYNRLIDVFLGLTAYSLQNHLRTSASEIGQAEIDELYVAVDRNGAQYVLPVQAKGGSDRIGYTQVDQDLAVCAEKFPGFIVRPIAVQFMRGGEIVLFELTFQDDLLVVVREGHYRLVNVDEITAADAQMYARIAGAATRDGSESQKTSSR